MNWRLIFSGLKSPGWAASACASVVLALVLSFWLLRLERKLVSRGVGGTLLLLRLLVLAVVLFTLMQPVLTKQFDVEQRGRVVVAIDASQSMETEDRHATLSEKLRWAQALGMLGNSETTDLIGKWVAAAEAGQPPNWLGTDALPLNPVEQARFDARAGQVQNSLDELAEMPRVEFVRRLLQSQPLRLLDQISEVMPVDLRLFATEQESATAENLGHLLQSERADLVPGSTDVVQLLQAVTAEEGAAQIRAIVLISDGRQTVPGDVSGAGQRLASLQVPVYSIPVGSRLKPRDLSIAAVDAPEAVFLNDEAQIRVAVGTSGLEGEPVTVRLERDGATVDQSTLTPASESTTITFSVPSDVAGRFDYKLVTDVQPGELRDDNNTRDVSLQVVDNKARVVLVDGDARWEFRYLKNVLDRDKQVEALTVLFHQPYLNLLNQPYIPHELPDIVTFREQLSRTDLLVVGDVAPQDVDEGIWELIEQSVARDGMTLLIIPGRQDMPHSYQSETLRALLPVQDFQPRIAEQFLATPPDADQTVYRLALTPEAHALPMFQLSPDVAANAGVFSALPGHPWIYAGVPKPGASVWANASIAAAAINPEPAVIHHDFGFGQVLWMGIDSTWRWRFRAGDKWHYKFWGQLIRWAARNKAAAGNDDVRMTLSDVMIDESENVDALVRWNPKLLPQLPGASVEIVATLIESDEAGRENRKDSGAENNVTDPATETQVVTVLQPSPDAPERYTGQMPRLAPGAWRVELHVTGGAVQMQAPVQTELFVRHQVSAELANVSCNRELLKEISDLSGGELIEPFDAARLVSLVQPRDQQEQKIQERTLWDHWLILMIFFILLTAEWVIRKLNGLP